MNPNFPEFLGFSKHQKFWKIRITLKISHIFHILPIGSSAYLTRDEKNGPTRSVRDVASRMPGEVELGTDDAGLVASPVGSQRFPSDVGLAQLTIAATIMLSINIHINIHKHGL